MNINNQDSEYKPRLEVSAFESLAGALEVIGHRFKHTEDAMKNSGLLGPHDCLDNTTFHVNEGNKYTISATLSAKRVLEVSIKSRGRGENNNKIEIWYMPKEKEEDNKIEITASPNVDNSSVSDKYELSRSGFTTLTHTAQIPTQDIKIMLADIVRMGEPTQPQNIDQTVEINL